MRAFYVLPNVPAMAFLGVALGTVLLILKLDGPGVAVAQWIRDIDLAVARATWGADARMGPLTFLATVATVAFTTLPVIVAGLACWAIGEWRDDPRLARFGPVVLRAGLLQVAVTETIKLITGRQRPILALAMCGGEWHDLWHPFWRWQSFPSGHAAFGMALCIIGLAYYPRGRPFWLALPLVLFAARFTLVRHYLSDIWAAAWIGGWVGALIAASYPALPDDVLRRIKARARTRSARCRGDTT